MEQSPRWSNGSLASLRGLCPKGRGGSNPPLGTEASITERAPRGGPEDRHPSGRPPRAHRTAWIAHAERLPDQSRRGRREADAWQERQRLELPDELVRGVCLGAEPEREEAEREDPDAEEQ